ncbi:MAG: hypothetical protein ACLTK0_08845 [Anaerovoracaceae bacterium]
MGERGRQLSAAFAEWLSETKPISRSRSQWDTTAGPKRLKGAKSMCRQGVTALDCGLASPAMFMSTVFEEFATEL